MAKEANDVNPASSTEETNTTDELIFTDEPEDNQPESTDAEEGGESNDQGENQEEKPVKSEEQDEGVPANSEPKGAEKRKQQLNIEIRDLVTARNNLRAEISRLNQEAYQNNAEVLDPQDLVDQVNPETGEYYTRTEAELASIRAELDAAKQQREIDAYTNKVVENQMAIQNDVARALKDFPMLDERSEEYDADLSSKVNTLLDAAIVRDPNTGQVINCNIPIYDLCAAVAQSAQAGRVAGEARARRSVQQMENSVDVLGSDSTPQNDDTQNDEFGKGLRAPAY